VKAFIEAPDAARGPFDREQLRDLYHRGEITGGTRIFVDDRWQPYSRVEPGVPRDSNAATKWIWVLTFIATVAATIYAIILSQSDLASRLSWSGPVAFAITLGAIGLAALIYSKRPPVYAQIAALTLSAAGVLGLVGINHLSVQRLEASVGVHTIEHLSSSRLRISGGIGVNLATDLRREIGAMPGAVVIELDSPGGSVDAALEAGEYLRDRGQVTTLVDNECLSACVAVFAGGNPRQMLPGASIGVHQVSANIGLSATVKEAGERYFRWLEARNFSMQLVTAGESTAPDNMAMFKAGANDAALEGIAIVSESGSTLTPAQQGMWLTRKHEEDLGKRMIDAIVASMPDLVEKFGPPLRKAILANDVDSYAATSGELGIAMAQRAMSFDQPDLVGAYLNVSYQPEVCDGAEPRDPQEQLMALLDGAAASSYRMAQRTSDRVWSQFLDRLSKHPLSKRLDGASEDKRECLVGQMMIGALMDTDAKLVPGIYRRMLEDE